MKRWGYFIVGMGLLGCVDDPAPCAGGEDAQIGEQAVCIFAEEHGIIENGFRCPPGRGEARGMHEPDGREVVVCSDEPVDAEAFARARGNAPPPPDPEPGPMGEPEVIIEPEPVEETICDAGDDASACDADTLVWCADGVEKREACIDGCGMVDADRFDCLEPSAPSICEAGPEASTCDGDVMRWCRGAERRTTCTFGCGARDAADPGCQRAGETDCRPDALDLNERINALRVDNGLDPLPCIGDISAVSRAHGQDMCERGYFDHITPDGLMFQDRLWAGGIITRLPGESIYRTEGRTLDVLFPDWVENEPGFVDFASRNVWTAMGASLVQCGDDGFWVINYID